MANTPESSHPQDREARESSASETVLDHESRLVSVVCTGKITSDRALKETAKARRQANKLGYRLLLDLSHAELSLGLAEAHSLATDPGVEVLAGEAITLVRPGAEHAEWFDFLSLTAANVGVLVRTFPDRESALIALSGAGNVDSQSRSKSDSLILVVDDDPDILALTSRVLRVEGYRVLEAATGQEGLEIAFQMKPDLVILDVILPDMDGREVCRILRADAGLSRSLVALTSGVRTSLADQEESLGGRPDAYLSRPISNKVLLSSVEFLLKNREPGRGPDLERRASQ